LVVQAPKGTFASAMSLGFCPDLDLVNKPCAGSGLKYDPQFAKLPAGAAADATPRVKGLVYRTAPSNTVPWVVFQGEVDQVCEPAATKEFVAQTGAGELVALPSVGHGYGVEKNWLPQFLDAHSRLISAGAAPVTTAPAVGDLPLVEVPARAEADAAQAGRFAILLTGDGGWAGLDQEVSAALAAQGVPVVGLNTLKYFWHARDPQAAANDLGRIIASYAAHWNAREVLLVGYSFGADVLPFLYNRLPVAQRAQVRTISLLGLSENASFEFHLSDWIPGRDGGAHPTVPEIGAMNGAAVLCLYGSDEKDSPCPTLKQPGVKPEALPGGHHLGGDYAGIAGRILDYSRR
jgi:type IV secretory pathway VirJ component